MDCPVLLIVFNRPSLTRRVLDALRAANVNRIYVAADGPRPHHTEDLARTREVRSLISAIDWTSEVCTSFQTHNLGCKRAVSSAIDWFFAHEERGIILEDDCVPIDAFFPYCEALLSRYQDDSRIAQISGSTFIAPPKVGSYWFSKYADIWGWASWRRAWRLADMTMTAWPEWRDAGGLAKLPGSTPGFANYWTRMFDDAYNDLVDTWDFAWMFACWRHGMMSVLPATPQIANIGFGPDATHTPHFDRANRHVAQIAVPLSFPLQHVDRIEIASARERAFTRVRYSVDPLAELAAVATRLGPVGRLSVRAAKALRDQMQSRSDQPPAKAAQRL
jgi:hypothetical protein